MTVCDEAEERRRLRDQFAAAALAGLLADGCDRCDMTQVCDRAYLWADVMILRRDNCTTQPKR